MTQDQDEPIPDTQRSPTHRDVARAALNGIACQLELDEVRVLTRIARLLREAL
jgi:hypothetical protein